MAITACFVNVPKPKKFASFSDKNLRLLLLVFGCSLRCCNSHHNSHSHEQASNFERMRLPGNSVLPTRGQFLKQQTPAFKMPNYGV